MQPPNFPASKSRDIPLCTFHHRQYFIGKIDQMTKVFERVIAGEEINKDSVPALLGMIEIVITKYQDVKQYAARMLGEEAPKKRARKRTAASA